MIHILASEYNPAHQALEIYVAGCGRKCPGCHNPEAQSYARGEVWDIWLAHNRFKLKKHMLVRHVWILGGDLLEQHDPHEACEVVRSIRHELAGHRSIWLWTGGEIEDVPREMLPLLAYVKTGRYCRERQRITYIYARDFLLPLASDNQKLWQVDNSGASFCAVLCPVMPESEVSYGHDYPAARIQAAQS